MSEERLPIPKPEESIKALWKMGFFVPEHPEVVNFTSQDILESFTQTGSVKLQPELKRHVKEQEVTDSHRNYCVNFQSLPPNLELRES